MAETPKEAAERYERNRPKIEAAEAELRGRAETIEYLPCSGQSGKGVFKRPRKNDWAIRSPQLPAHWRATDKSGRVRTFPTHEAAERAARKMRADEFLKGEG